MSKYDKMVEKRKQYSKEKVDRALNAIQRLKENEEVISVSRLMEMTDLSRGFFYKNAEVRKAFDKAVESQTGTIDPKRRVLDLALERKIELLEKKCKKLEQENEKLKEENKKLLQTMKRRNLDILKEI